MGFSYFSGTIGLFTSVIFAFFIVCLNNKIGKNDSKKMLIFFSVTLLLFWHQREMNIGGIITFVLKLFCFFSILQLDYIVLNAVRNKFLKLFAIVSSISLFFWCLYLVGINVFPSSIITMDGVYELENHVVFITSYNSPNLYKRFQCLFVEPGLYGLLCVICLILNNFGKDFKSVIFIISCLFSISLAAYLLMIVLLLYRFYIAKKFKLINYLVPVVIIWGVYHIGVNYNGGDNILNNAIFWRLTLDDDNKLSHYNRRTEDFDNYYEKNIHGDKLLLGIGAKEYSARHFENSVDLKGFIALNGVIGLVLFLLYYYRVLKIVRLDRDTLLVLLVFLIIFYRGFVMTLSLGGLLLYYLSVITIGIDSRDKNENIICSS